MNGVNLFLKCPPHSLLLLVLLLPSIHYLCVRPKSLLIKSNQYCREATKMIPHISSDVTATLGPLMTGIAVPFFPHSTLHQWWFLQETFGTEGEITKWILNFFAGPPRIMVIRLKCVPWIAYVLTFVIDWQYLSLLKRPAKLLPIPNVLGSSDDSALRAIPSP